LILKHLPLFNVNSGDTVRVTVKFNNGRLRLSNLNQLFGTDSMVQYEIGQQSGALAATHLNTRNTSTFTLLDPTGDLTQTAYSDGRSTSSASRNNSASSFYIGAIASNSAFEIGGFSFEMTMLSDPSPHPQLIGHGLPQDFNSWNIDLKYLTAELVAVPEPSTYLLLGLGLIGLASIRKKAIQKK